MIYVFLAEGFEEVEALTPVDCLRRAGKTVCTVGVGGSVIRSSHGIPVQADIAEADVQLDDALEMIVLPGGMPGTLNLEANDTVQRAIAYMVEQDRWVGAICAAPSILGHLGLLSGREAVCYPGFEDALAGAKVGTQGVARDGKFITARGAGKAMEFGVALVAALSGQAAADDLAKKMVYGV